MERDLRRSDSERAIARRVLVRVWRGPHSRAGGASVCAAGEVPGFTAALAFAVWLALAHGLAEAGILFGMQLVEQRATFPYSVDVLWMAPLATSVIFAALVALLTLAGWLHPQAATRGALAFSAIALSVYGLVRVAGAGVHPVAALVLAAGAGAQAARLASRSTARLDRLVRRSLPVLALGIALFGFTRVLGQRYGWLDATVLRAHASRGSLPNVLLIILDTVRKHDLSLYGYDVPTTPNLERLAKLGVRFDAAVAPSSWTLPSHASVFTGLHHHQLALGWSESLQPGPPTLAEVLSGAGYATGGFVGNIWYAGRSSGLQRGFEVYHDHVSNAGTLVRSAWLTRTLADLVLPPTENAHFLGRKDAAAVNRDFLRWIDREDGRRPFFAFLNYFDAHEPYRAAGAFRSALARTHRVPPDDTAGSALPAANPAAPVPEYLRASREEYDAAIAYMDSEIGRLMDALRFRGLLDRTLVVVTSDHGEQFGETRADLVGHGNSLYYSTLGVPLLIVFPPAVPAGLEVPDVVELRSLATTVIDLVEGVDARGVFPGLSLTGFWHPTGDGPARPLALSEVTPGPFGGPADPVRKGPMRSLVAHGLHYIRNGDGTEELYDLRVDPWENHNVIDDARTEAEQARFRAWMALGGADGS